MTRIESCGTAGAVVPRVGRDGAEPDARAFGREPQIEVQAPSVCSHSAVMAAPAGLRTGGAREARPAGGPVKADRACRGLGGDHGVLEVQLAVDSETVTEERRCAGGVAPTPGEASQAGEQVERFRRVAAVSARMRPATKAL